GPMRVGEGRERNHLPDIVPHIPPVQILRQHPGTQVTLDEHLLDPPPVEELIDVRGAPARGQGVTDGGDGHPQGAGLLPVDVKLVLRLVVQPVGTQHTDRGIFRGELEQLTACLHQYLVPHRGPIDELEVKAGGVAQLEHRRWSECHHLRTAYCGKILIGAGDDRGNGIVALTPFRTPAFQTHEAQSGALSVTTETEAADREHRVHTGLLQEVLPQQIERMLRDLHGRTRWRDHLTEQYALVLIREERLRNPYEQHAHQDGDRNIDQQVPASSVRDVVDASRIAVVHSCEVAVKPAEKAAVMLQLRTFRFGWPQQCGAQRRCQDQRDHDRQGHGRNDGDRELPVDHTRGAAEKGHWQEDSRQYQGNTDQGAGDL